jgi:hypothetical protein
MPDMVTAGVAPEVSVRRDSRGASAWSEVMATSEAAAMDVDGAPMWARQPSWTEGGDWRNVDRELRTIARRRAALDADEARWLREAEALQIWRPLGMVSALDYMERVLGYGPRAAQERLRVARALGQLPVLTASLAGGELPFSAVRELTRVVLPATESAWVRAAEGKNLRQIEDLVAGHVPGDLPGDPPHPEARTHVVRYEVSAETYALLRQAKAALDDEHGTSLDDDAFVAALARTVLDGSTPAEPSGRARYQIAVTVCERCRQGWQDGAGVKVAIGAAAVARAECDAQHVGSIDANVPVRATQDVPPAVVRLVWRRDGGRCRVPGCRSARGLEIHHIVHRAYGGTHDAANCVLLCSACHGHHHAGRLAISGTADRLEVRRVAEARLAEDSSVAAPVDVSGERTRAHVGAEAGAIGERELAHEDEEALVREDSRVSVNEGDRASARGVQADDGSAASASDARTAPTWASG